MEKANSKVQNEVQGHLDVLSHVIEREKPLMKVNLVDIERFAKTQLCTYSPETVPSFTDFIPTLDQLSAKTIGDLMRQRLARLDF